MRRNRLEMIICLGIFEFTVHCRTGSLEIQRGPRARQLRVHCRTGSLEKTVLQGVGIPVVHCRTGSLERVKNG